MADLRVVLENFSSIEGFAESSCFDGNLLSLESSLFLKTRDDPLKTAKIISRL